MIFCSWFRERTLRPRIQRKSYQLFFPSAESASVLTMRFRGATSAAPQFAWTRFGYLLFAFF